METARSDDTSLNVGSELLGQLITEVATAKLTEKYGPEFAQPITDDRSTWEACSSAFGRHALEVQKANPDSIIYEVRFGITPYLETFGIAIENLFINFFGRDGQQLKYPNEYASGLFIVPAGFEEAKRMLLGFQLETDGVHFDQERLTVVSKEFTAAILPGYPDRAPDPITPLRRGETKQYSHGSVVAVRVPIIDLDRFRSTSRPSIRLLSEDVLSQAGEVNKGEVAFVVATVRSAIDERVEKLNA